VSAAANARVVEAISDDLIARCFPVMRELRPHLEEATFVARVRAQMTSGYLLAFVDDGGRAVSATGYRFGVNLAWGRHVYVDDLVSLAECRGRGHGGVLLRWVIDLARSRGCESVHLDSGVHRFGAHRFYLGLGFDITSHHFALRLR